MGLSKKDSKQKYYNSFNDDEKVQELSKAYRLRDRLIAFYNRILLYAYVYTYICIYNKEKITIKKEMIVLTLCSRLVSKLHILTIVVANFLHNLYTDSLSLTSLQ